MERLERLRGEWIELPGAGLYYEPDFLKDPDILFDDLKQNAAWRQDRIRLFGREHRVPRLSAWYGDADAVYRYSGLRLEPMPWLAALADLRRRLQTHLARPFNSVLLNYYRHGGDGMGRHADDEPELGPRPLIAMISLGAVRRFVLTPRQKGMAESWRRDLANGSLLVMAGDCQRHWRHELPKTRRVVAGRISLTYRQVQAKRHGDL